MTSSTNVRENAHGRPFSRVPLQPGKISAGTHSSGVTASMSSVLPSASLSVDSPFKSTSSPLDMRIEWLRCKVDWLLIFL